CTRAAWTYCFYLKLLLKMGGLQYDGLEASELKRLKQIEQEHERLKKMYAELSLMSRMQEEIIKKL
ncbi:hypothetical protein QP445_14610, partial [Micrococcus luteus]|nr:hypothetical protein [Micrococcus luteus]